MQRVHYFCQNCSDNKQPDNDEDMWICSLPQLLEVLSINFHTFILFNNCDSCYDFVVDYAYKNLNFSAKVYLCINTEKKYVYIYDATEHELKKRFEVRFNSCFDGSNLHVFIKGSYKSA